MAEPRSRVRERWLRLLHGGEEPVRALAEAVRAAGSALPGSARGELLALPLAADRARVRHWLLARLEEAGPAPEPALRLRLAHARWHGRLEGCDLSLSGAEGAAGEPAGSVVLAACARLAARTDPPDPLLAEELPLAWAALLGRALLAELDPALVLAGHAAREVSVGFEGGPRVELGVYGEGGWAD